MFFGSKKINELTYEDIEQFIGQQITENLFLDYKKELTSTKELAKDVSSFANTEGGILIYGIETDNSDEPKPLDENPIVGIINKKRLKEKIENQIISSIFPVPKFLIHIIPIPEEEKLIIIIEIYKSFNSVHMLTVNKDFRYYKRYNFQSVPMSEIEVNSKYKEIGQTEKTIEKRIIKSIKRINNIIPRTIDEGLSALIITPLNLQRDFFNDYERIEGIIKRQNELDYAKYGRMLKRKQDRFHKPLIFGDDETVGFLDVYYDGMLVIGRRIDLFEPDRLNASALYYNIYYSLKFSVELFSEFKTWSYLKINYYLENITGKKLGFIKNSGWVSRKKEFDEEYEPFEENFSLIWLSENIEEVSKSIILPLFYSCDFHDLSGCADDSGVPIYKQ